MIYSRIYQQNPHSKHTKEQILHYTIFSIECDFKYHLPITIAQLALFIAYLQNKSFAARTISTYVSALDFIHKINKLPDPTEALLIEKRIQSLHKQKRSDSRLPITSSILNQLVNALSYTVSSKFDQTLTSMLTLTYHGLLRIGEMTVNNNSCMNVIDLNQLEN
jgi:hypothetical protein